MQYGTYGLYSAREKIDLLTWAAIATRPRWLVERFEPWMNCSECVDSQTVPQDPVLWSGLTGTRFKVSPRTGSKSVCQCCYDKVLNSITKSLISLSIVRWRNSNKGIILGSILLIGIISTLKSSFQRQNGISSAILKMWGKGKPHPKE